MNWAHSVAQREAPGVNGQNPRRSRQGSRDRRLAKWWTGPWLQLRLVWSAGGRGRSRREFCPPARAHDLQVGGPARRGRGERDLVGIDASVDECGGNRPDPEPGTQRLPDAVVRRRCRRDRERHPEGRSRQSVGTISAVTLGFWGNEICWALGCRTTVHAGHERVRLSARAT